MEPVQSREYFKWNLCNPGDIFHGRRCQALAQSAGVQTTPLGVPRECVDVALGTVVGADCGDGWTG